MFPFHTLVFAFWRVIVDPHLVPSNNAPKKGLTFIMIVVQQALADCKIVALVLSCELFWNPSCTNFMKAKSVLNNSMSRTVTVPPLH
jgi:hypothetical protein